LGVLHIFEVVSPNVEPREAEIHQAGFLRLDELRSLRDRMESWSQICMDALYPENA
jgi:predicted NUDIX family phosphoesterase